MMNSYDNFSSDESKIRKLTVFTLIWKTFTIYKSTEKQFETSMNSDQHDVEKLNTKFM